MNLTKQPIKVRSRNFDSKPLLIIFYKSFVFGKNFFLCANINTTDSFTAGDLLIYFVCFADLYFASVYFKVRNRPTHVMRASYHGTCSSLSSCLVRSCETVCFRTIDCRL